MTAVQYASPLPDWMPAPVVQLDEERAGTALDPTSPVPLYFQVEGWIRGEYLRHGWEDGHRFPSERDLCAIFGVSRATVRQAMARLVAVGLFHRVKGAGTFAGAAPRRGGLRRVGARGVEG